MREICGMLPKINKNVFIFIIKFFRKVVEQQEHNRMTLHNLATVVTPNLFRPFELTPNDLIFAGHLVETFKIMIEKYKYIFSLEGGVAQDSSEGGSFTGGAAAEGSSEGGQ
jgi:hypothetical protein